MTHFNTQSLLSIVLDTEYADLATASVRKILYRKPSGATGSWDAVIHANTSLRYDLSNGDINEIGNWQFQAYIEVGGLKGFGNVVNHDFLKPVYYV